MARDERGGGIKRPVSKASAAAEGEDKPRVRGLPSIQEMREQRASGKSRWPSVKFWGYSGLVLAIVAILHWKWSQGEVDSGRQKLLADQRGVAAELGPRWFPLRDKIEGWTVGLAKEMGPELTDREALAKWDFRDKPGIYLRLRVEDAGSPTAIRDGAKNSLRDAFTSCLTRAANPSAIAGKECKRSRDCPAQEFCNEQDHCSKPAQPYNLRVAYRTLSILSEEWVREVQEASTDIRLRLFQATYDDAVRDDLPLAARLLQQAQYFLVVLDETPAGLALPAADAGTSAAEAVAGASHFARIGLWRLSDGKPVLRIRREAGAQLLGGVPGAEASVLEARQRQANSCSLALSVREAMGDASAAGAPAAP